MYRGEAWRVQLPINKSDLQRACRPVLVISNNAFNKYSSVITYIQVITRSHKRKDLQTHVDVISDMDIENTILYEQILTVSRMDDIQKLLYKLD